MHHSLWVLAMVLTIGKGEVIIKPIAIYDPDAFGQYACYSDRNEKSRKYKIPLTCFQGWRDV